MMKRAALIALAIGFTAIGLIGLLIPVIPGVLFLVLAAGCISLASDRVHQKFSASPRYRRWRQRWDSSSGLSPLNRTKLAFWISVDSAFGRHHQ